jgi:glycerophosphoryl diester phosphodiesterase
MIYSQFPRPAIIAHRGASAYAPENTLASFELALRQGADAVELDAKLTADGHIVVIHDQTVDRTTQGSGKVRELTLAEIRKLDAGSHFDVAFKGEPVPTLEEVFKAVGQLTFINVELTNYASLADNLPDQVAALVRRMKLTRRVFFSSFNPIAILRIRKLLPECPAGLLAGPGVKGAWARSWIGRLLGYQALHPEQDDVTPKLVETAHRRNQPILVWTVNREDKMRQLFDMGVDGIFTDDPARARQVLSMVNR